MAVVPLFGLPKIVRAAVLSPGGSISGTVVDASDGIPISDVVITVVGTTRSVRTDATGAFTLSALRPGHYVLSIARKGYQPAVSDEIDVGATPISVTLALQRAGENLRVIAVTSSHAADLQRSSTFTKSFDSEGLQRAGMLRIGDVLQTAPGVNNGIPGNTASLADDLHLSIRGIGTLETVAAIDGHPIGYGIKGGYNYQLSPVYPYRDVDVLYGSGGSDLLGVNAIGGVVNFQTLDPTPQREFTLTQGFGTFDQLSTSLRATGTVGRLGYAFAYGVSGLDGPFRNNAFYQTGAAFDQSVLSGPIHDLGIYVDDSAAKTTATMLKLRIAVARHSSITLTSVIEDRWVDKTGNGDGDYLGYAPALAFGNRLLTEYDPANYPALQPCAPGTFVGTNANGAPNGFGPDGKPDGGITCQTPQQYAAFNAGWDGAGPAWQSIKLNDNALTYRLDTARSTVRLNLFNSYYANLSDRTARLPFARVATDRASWSNAAVNETGAIVSDEFIGVNNSFAAGASYLNNAYTTFSKGALKGAPMSTDVAYFVSDAYHPRASPMSAFADVWAKRSTATDTSYVDSRAAVAYRLSPKDVVRASVGSTTTQPSADMIGQDFIGSFTSGAGGGTPINCSGLNSIGSAPSRILKPERGLDKDVAYAHRWEGDTRVQITLYDTIVFDKLYSTIVPLSETGTGFIPPAFLAQATAAVAGKCGAPIAPSLLGTTGNFNVGTLRARGADVSGRARISPSFYVDYDWALTSTVLSGANVPMLQKTTSLILGDQLAKLPLHTFVGSADYTLPNGLDTRYTLYTVSANNTKSLPPYNYSDLAFALPIGRSVAGVTISNIFNQWSSIAGLRYEGVPQALNDYASLADYSRYTGAAATERFGLPYRTIFFSYQMVW